MLLQIVRWSNVLLHVAVLRLRALPSVGHRIGPDPVSPFGRVVVEAWLAVIIALELARVRARRQR